MDIFISSKTSHCPETNSSGGSLVTDPHSLIQNKEDLSMTDLKTCLTELMNVEDTGISTGGFKLALEKNDINIEVIKTICNDSEKCLRKSATFPPPRGLSGEKFVGEKAKHEEVVTYEVSEGNGSAITLNRCYSRSTSLPVPLKPLSAMKGSRERRQGTPSSKKLSVTWAPDVYDPVPTSVSHVPSEKNHRYRNKKYGKYNKQKSSGKSSRGSKSKDSKKQGRKSSGGGSNKLKQPFYVDGFYGSPDPFCGSSFLKESVSKLHYPVAEAT